MSHTPYHHAQMTQSLPGWSKALHSEHASRILARLRKDYQDAEGNAYPWYSQADPLTRQAVQRAIATRDASSRALQAALSDLQGVTAFCAPTAAKAAGHRHPGHSGAIRLSSHRRQATGRDTEWPCSTR